jgi:hypothetical protein
MYRANVLAFFVVVIMFNPIFVHDQPDVPQPEIEGQPFQLDSPDIRGTDLDPRMSLPSLEGYFTENLGQSGPGAGCFYVHGDGLSVSLGVGWVSYHLRQDDGTGANVRITFGDAFDVTPVGVHPLSHASDFFIGNDPEGWVVGARNYKEVLYGGLYPGIDLRFYVTEEMLKYDFIIGPGGDAATIRMAFEGAEGVSLDPANGDLLIATGAGTLRDMAPIAYQDGPDGVSDIEARFRVSKPSSVSFIIGDYDPSAVLVIDPGLVFSTFLGGSSTERCGPPVVDENGDIYLGGDTYSPDFPLTTGAVQTENKRVDAFVVKLSADGSQLLYSTYIGGDQTDHEVQVQVGPSDMVYIVGRTNSSDFPVTSNGLQQTFNGEWDCFVSRLDIRASKLDYSSYLGGNSHEVLRDIQLVASGDLYVTGNTYSRDFPITNDALPYNITGPFSEIFLLRLDVENESLEYSTFIAANGSDTSYCLFAEEDGIVYVAGYTNSEDFPTTPGAYRTSHIGRQYFHDGFVLKLDTSSSSLVYSTYFGGDIGDYATAIFVDDEGYAYLTGETASDDFPTTPGAYDRDRAARQDAFVLKMDQTGSDIEYSTFVGSMAAEYPIGIDVSDMGYIAITGSTRGDDYPVTPDAFDSTFNGSDDAFLTVLLPDVSDLYYSTFIGGNKSDRASGFTMLDWGVFLIAGETYSSDFPTTLGSFDPTFNGTVRDAFLLELDLFPAVIGNVMYSTPITTGDPVDIEADVQDNLDIGGVELHCWYDGDPTVFRTPMSLDSGTLKNGHWNCSIIVPDRRSGRIHLMVQARDQGGNMTTSDIFSVTIIDNDLPSIEPLPPGAPTTGEILPLSVNITENVGIDEVALVYWYGTSTSNSKSVKMKPIDVTVHGEGLYAYNDLRIPRESLRPLNFYYTVVDTSGNENSTSPVLLEVTDNDIPEIIDDTSDRTTTTGDHFIFQMTCWDNIGLATVNVSYHFGDSETTIRRMLGEEITSNGNGKYALRIKVPSNITVNLVYWFDVVDYSGHTKRTTPRFVEVKDNDRPMILSDGTVDQALKGLTLTFQVHVLDNIGIAEVIVRFRDEMGVMQYVPMVGSVGHYHVTHSVSRLAVGDVLYSFYVEDTARNSNTTDERTISLINAPPEIGEVPTFEVIEGETETLDLSAYITDLNDAIDNLTIMLDPKNARYWKPCTTNGSQITTSRSRFPIVIVRFG